MPDRIENIIFSRFVKQPIPFEIITIEELDARCKKSAFNLSESHRIEFHALIIITEGKSTHMIDFNEHALFPGVILPLTKDQVHSFHKSLKVKGVVISFEENFITQNINETNLFHFLHLYHTTSLLIGEEHIPLLLPFIDLLHRVQQESNNNLKAEFIRNIFLSLLIQIKRLTIYQHQMFESQRFKDFIRFKQLLKEHYARCHNANEYAAMLNVSYKYLNDICKEMGSKTAKTFIDHWLLLEIKRNLSEKKYTSQEIAYKMGFEEPSNFSRFFKKYTGVAPSQFSGS